MDNTTEARPFTCATCEKKFKRKQHLQVHETICTGYDKIARPFQCAHCDSSFRLKHHLQNHVKAKHSKDDFYICRKCDGNIMINVHEKEAHENEHRKFHCEFCKYVGDKKHEKRHMKAKHKNLTPSTTVYGPKKPVRPLCEICHKTFFCSSTLKRHKDRFHKKLVCTKEIQDVSKQKKSVTFKSNLVDELEIPFSKVKTKGVEEAIENLFNSVEQVMTVFTNRKQTISISGLVDHVEKQSKKTFDVLLFRVLVTFDLYRVNLVKGDIEVCVEEDRLTPSINNKRREKLNHDLKVSATFNYIDVVNLPEKPTINYITAKEVIEKNVFQVKSHEIKETTKQNKKLSLIERLRQQQDIKKNR